MPITLVRSNPFDNQPGVDHHRESLLFESCISYRCMGLRRTVVCLVVYNDKMLWVEHVLKWVSVSIQGRHDSGDQSTPPLDRPLLFSALLCSSVPTWSGLRSRPIHITARSEIIHLRHLGSLSAVKRKKRTPPSLPQYETVRQGRPFSHHRSQHHTRSIVSWKKRKLAPL